MNKDNFENYYSEYDKMARDEMAANIKADYDEKYILKSLFLGKTRDELAEEFNHKSYRTLDMYMRRRGYAWDNLKQNYVLKPSETPRFEMPSTTSKVDKIISLFESGLDPREIAKKVGMKDHRTMAMYMKDKGYIWSTEVQNYVLLKGEQKPYVMDSENSQENRYGCDIEDVLSVNMTSLAEDISPSHFEGLSKNERIEKLLPMLEMLERNKEKLAEILSINDGSTIPRYVVGGITITKSLCMSHNLAELVKEFSKEKNISQREIFEVSIIEFLRKYGYENEVKTLFG